MHVHKRIKRLILTDKFGSNSQRNVRIIQDSLFKFKRKQ